MSFRSQPSRGPRASLRIAALLSTAACAVTMAPAARAQDAIGRDLADKIRMHRCSVAALRGSYGFSVHGFTDAVSAVPPALQGPFAAVGTTAYDGAGKVTITPRSASFNGFVQQVPAEQGRYSVSSDCVVTAQYPSGVTTRGVLIDDGRAMYAIQTNAGTTIAGTALRADARPDDSRDRTHLRCTNDALAGRYGFLAEGYAGPPTLPLPSSVPLVGNGVVTLERSGAFTLQAVRSVGGLIDPQTVVLSGAFSVGADCAVQMKFDVGFTFAGTAVDAGDEILFVQTDPGTTLIVKARRQD